jgi:shikimate dehydrogenase
LHRPDNTENARYRGGFVPEQQTFLSLITGSFATPAAENPTVAMIEAAYEHHHINARYINCDVAPDALGDAVRGARAMGWAGFNCSIPHKVSVITYLDGLSSSAALIGAVNCVVRRDNRYIGENTDGQGFLACAPHYCRSCGKSVRTVRRRRRRARDRRGGGARRGDLDHDRKP